MKTKIVLTFLFLLSISLCQAQNPAAERFIEVTGEGEVKVDPNIIYLSIDLREFKKDGKIVKLEDLETQLTNVMQTVGIPKENLKVTATSGRQLDLRKKKSNLLIRKRYNLKLDDIDLLYPLLTELTEVDILYVDVTEVSHTEIEKFKNEAKVKAITNAKDKAVLLTSTLESKIGQVQQIREVELIDAYPLQALRGRVAGIHRAVDDDMFSYQANYKGGQSNSVDFEQIKLLYKIVVKFKIE
jgi:uncharacterized protein